ncbi:hypothetical protein QC763_114530 [Podospora pseudopauciseta]|uniref:Mitochondrial pyruvate carrier n=1 Tax=Podospora pseudopauciseta TaxID=2093780 RepID=A0ABR0I035_9PEZI|nr:hypothetical protein QC763_114530 [Podospora pseudopauciseta]
MSTIFRASRPAFRARTFFQQNASKTTRRFQSTESTANAAPESWMQQFWKSEKGPKTVHFWAPMMKWGLVLVGISDFARPAESLSLTQNAALTTTGIIWTRWCLIIKPKNYLLAAVNFFLGCVGVIQCSRIFLHHQAQKKLAEEVGEAKEAVKEAKEAIKHKSS